MKKKFLGMLAVFALVITGIFGFVGCKNKEEGKTETGLTEADVVGTYDATQVALTVAALELDAEVFTKADYTALVNKEVKDAHDYTLIAYLENFFGTYHLTANKNILVDDETDAMATWRIENNQLVCTVVTEGEDVPTITSTTFDNGTINVSMNFETQNFSAVLTLVKQ